MGASDDACCLRTDSFPGRSIRDTGCARGDDSSEDCSAAAQGCGGRLRVAVGRPLCSLRTQRILVGGSRCNGSGCTTADVVEPRGTAVAMAVGLATARGDNFHEACSSKQPSVQCRVIHSVYL